VPAFATKESVCGLVLASRNLSERPQEPEATEIIIAPIPCDTAPNGNPPWKEVAVITAAVPDVDPEIVMVGKDVKFQPEWVIDTVAIAPPETV
jgi:hypothetical protein